MVSTLKVGRIQKLVWGVWGRKLQAQPKILKKIIRTSNIPIKTKNFLKNYFSYLKSVKEPKIRMRNLPTEFACSTQNPKKKFGTSNLPIKTKIIKKKCMVSIPCKWKGFKNSYEGYPKEFAPGAQKTIELKLS
jgi:hypothetical protein